MCLVSLLGGSGRGVPNEADSKPSRSSFMRQKGAKRFKRFSVVICLQLLVRFGVFWACELQAN